MSKYCVGDFVVGDTVKMLTTSSRWHRHGDIMMVKKIRMVYIGSKKYGNNTQYLRVGDDPGFWNHTCFELVKRVSCDFDEELFEL